MTFVVRDFCPADTDAVNRVALAAFDEYRSAYDDWPALASSIGNMATLSQQSKVIVAATPDSIIGAVAYVGPGKPKAAFFDPEWPIIRMLVVHPQSRGQGAGRALTAECIRRAERDGSSCIALHTTPLMKIALSMYERMDFKFQRDAPALLGVPYGIYLKALRVKPSLTMT